MSLTAVEARKHSMEGGLKASRQTACPELPYARIFIGEAKASANPLLLQTLLGSCVAVCLHDPLSGIGGMNHILLPGRSKEGSASRFGVHTMELLINEMMKLGADRRRLVAKCCGGGNVVPCFQSPTVGDRNAQFVREFLSTENIPLLAQRLGGCHAVQVSFRTDTGNVRVHSVGGSPLQVVVNEERKLLRKRPTRHSVKEEITLF